MAEESSLDKVVRLSRHVKTPEGVKKYGKPIGSPLGGQMGQTDTRSMMDAYNDRIHKEADRNVRRTAKEDVKKNTEGAALAKTVSNTAHQAPTHSSSKGPLAGSSIPRTVGEDDELAQVHRAVPPFSTQHEASKLPPGKRYGATIHHPDGTVTREVVSGIQIPSRVTGPYVPPNVPERSDKEKYPKASDKLRAALLESDEKHSKSVTGFIAADHSDEVLQQQKAHAERMIKVMADKAKWRIIIKDIDEELARRKTEDSKKKLRGSAS